MWFSLITLVTSLAHAACDPTRLAPELDMAEAAFVAGDAGTLSDAFDAAEASLECQLAPLTPELAARIHRTHALVLHLDGQHQEATLSLQAMLHADPFTTVPTTLVPDYHALRVLLTRAEEADWRWTPLKIKPGESVVVDGVPSLLAPAVQPYVLQKLDDTGAMVQSRLVPRGAAPVDKGVVKLTDSNADSRTPRSLKPERTPVSAAAKRLRWASVGLAVGAGALYGGAWASNSAYVQAVEAQDDAVIGGRHTTTNALAVGSVAAGTTALSTLLIAEVIKR